jgi:hypothetical protein
MPAAAHAVVARGKETTDEHRELQHLRRNHAVTIFALLGARISGASGRRCGRTILQQPFYFNKLLFVVNQESRVAWRLEVPGNMRVARRLTVNSVGVR